MVVTDKQITEIAKTVIGRDYDFEHIGLRVQESDYGIEIGQEIDHRSYHWIDGDMTEDEIDGICTVSVRRAAERVLPFGAYMGNVVLVLGSNIADGGEDIGELILRPYFNRNPIVLDIIRL